MNHGKAKNQKCYMNLYPISLIILFLLFFIFTTTASIFFVLLLFFFYFFSTSFILLTPSIPCFWSFHSFCSLPLHVSGPSIPCLCSLPFHVSGPFHSLLMFPYIPCFCSLPFFLFPYIPSPSICSLRLRLLVFS